MVLNLTVIGSLVVSLLGGAFADDPGPQAPPPDHVVIDVATINGSGCPAGTAAIAVSPDNTRFTVGYSAYVASVGVGSTAVDFRKNCQLSLVIHSPQGWSYAVTDDEYRGFASLAPGATATARINTYFQGATATAWRAQTFSGPLYDDWAFVNSPDPASLQFSACGALRNFNINTELRVSTGTSDPRRTTSFLAMDESHGFNLLWRPCAPA